MGKRIKKNEYIKFGMLVRKHRVNLEITQEELALRTSLDRTYISGIERGIRNVSLKNILKISHELKIHPALLFNDIVNDDKK